MAQPCTPLQMYKQDGEYDMEDAEAQKKTTKEQAQEQKQEEEEEVVFTRENRGGSAQHATRATPMEIEQLWMWKFQGQG